jgi:spoIIIJ-associated protein
MDKAEIIKQHTEELINKMVDSAEIEITPEEEVFHVNIKVAEEAPTVIGRHGETIRALQKILEVIVFKQTGEKVDLLINVNDYREKQTSRLQYIASEAAKKVEERQSATYLRGFSSYERRLMHEYVAQNFPELTSYSVGEGRDRRLVVDTKANKPAETSEGMDEMKSEEQPQESE